MRHTPTDTSNTIHSRNQAVGFSRSTIIHTQEQSQKPEAQSTNTSLNSTKTTPFPRGTHPIQQQLPFPATTIFHDHPLFSQHDTDEHQYISLFICTHVSNLRPLVPARRTNGRLAEFVSKRLYERIITDFTQYPSIAALTFLTLASLDAGWAFDSVVGRAQDTFSFSSRFLSFLLVTPHSPPIIKALSTQARLT